MNGSKVQGRRLREEREMERREHERERRAAAIVVRENEMDGKGEKFGQQFFRVFMPELYGERLSIPPAFHQYLQNQPTGVVSLKAQSGNTWLAELDSDREGFFFGSGWKEFVEDHSLEFGNFLTFCYDGCSQFSVVVFDGMCIEKPSTFHAKPCKDLVIYIENNEGDMEIIANDPSEIPSASLEESNETIRKRIREIYFNDSILKKCSSVLENGRKKGHGNSVGSFNNTVDPSEVVPLEERNANRMKRVGQMGMNESTINNFSTVLEKGIKISDASAGTYKVAAETSLDLNRNVASISEVTSKEKSCISTRKRFREMYTDGSKLKKFSNVSEKSKQQCPGASVGTYKVASTSYNSTEEYNSSSGLEEESISCNKYATSMPLLKRVVKGVTKHGKSNMTSQRHPAVISQRPPITDEQKNHALQKAKKFKSKNPFVLQIMKESYVNVGFFMKLPCEFVKECLPRTSKNITLWDPQGRAWKVNYIYYKEQSSGAFSGGWSKFSLGNYLEKYDVCIFELFSEDNIKVHIYRVVPEIAPFLPVLTANNRVGARVKDL